MIINQIFRVFIFLNALIIISCRNSDGEWGYDESLCLEHVNKISEGLSNGDYWAFRVIDSWGKIPSGVMVGNLNSMGHYDQCVETEFDLKEYNIFHGQFCLMAFEVGSFTSLLTLASKVFNAIKKFDESFPMGKFEINSTSSSDVIHEYKFQLGMCIPSQCSPTFFRTILSLVLNEYNLTISPTVTDANCATKHIKPFRALEIFAAIFFVVILGLMILSTCYDVYVTNSNNSKNSILAMFSVYTNGKKLFSIKTTKSSDVISCLNGIRVLSIIWIVYGHSHMMYGRVPIYNPEFALTWVSRYQSMLVISATVAVDSFFAISGLLVTFLTLKELDKRNGKINILAILLHRYLRLTPVLGAVILFMMTFYKYLGSGPMWQVAVDARTESCNRNWWVAFLYLQNYLEPNEMCLSESWYLSIDFQLFVFAPFLVIIIRKFEWKAIRVIICIIMAITCYMFLISYEYKFKTSPFRRDKDGGRREKMIYNATHTRMLAWLIGVILGFILHKTRNTKIKLSQYQVAFGWLSSLTTILLIIFGPYELQQYDNPEPQIQTSLYESLHRSSWCIALSWIIFACHHGYGGVINDFLSLGFWQPISRLTYSIYLIHIEVQVLRLTTLRNPVYLTEFNGIHAVWGDFGISMTIAVLWTLAFESPFLVLEQILMKSVAPQKPIKNDLIMNELKNNNLNNKQLNDIEDINKIETCNKLT